MADNQFEAEIKAFIWRMNPGHVTTVRIVNAQVQRGGGFCIRRGHASVKRALEAAVEAGTLVRIGERGYGKP